MHRGTTIDRRPLAVVLEVSGKEAATEGERLLTTAEANVFLRRAKGFLEKRRTSGVDSPPFIQAVKNGPVRYRVADLLAWEEARMRTCTFA